MNIRRSFLGIIILVLGLILWKSFQFAEAKNKSVERQLAQSQAKLSEALDDNQRLSHQLNDSRSDEKPSETLRELLRLRSKLTTLQTQQRGQGDSNHTDTLKGPSDPGDASTNSIQRIPRESWRFEGYANPQSAFESVMWAMNAGDVQTFWNSLTPEAQDALAKQYEGKTQDQIASLLKEEASHIGSLRFDRVRDVSDSETTFLISSKEQDDGNSRMRDEEVARFTNVGGIWKLNGF